MKDKTLANNELFAPLPKVVIFFYFLLIFVTFIIVSVLTKSYFSGVF